MPIRAMLSLLLGLVPLHDGTAEPPPVGLATVVPEAACPDGAVSPFRDALCAQLAAAARLRADGPAGSTAPLARSGGAGKGALVGWGVGLVPGILAALIVAPGCEENQSKCAVSFIVLGSALGAGIGAIVGAVVGD